MPSLNFNIPADKRADMIDALWEKYGVPAATLNELITIMEGKLKAELRETYRAYMKRKPYDVSLD
jgi:hypothetical protein